MDKKLNLIEVLKDCPKGTRLYSPICGEVEFVSTSGAGYPIEVVPVDADELEYCPPITFLPDGRYAYFPHAECLLFPSSENRDWSTFEVERINTLPKTWEEFCETHPRKDGEAYIGRDSNVCIFGIISRRTPEGDKNVLPHKKYAEAMLALCQLVQLRDCYNDGWQPDWTNHNEVKHSIYNWCGCVDKINRFNDARILSFKSEELRDEFLKNFRDLIEIAKPLL